MTSSPISEVRERSGADSSRCSLRGVHHVAPRNSADFKREIFTKCDLHFADTTRYSIAFDAVLEDVREDFDIGENIGQREGVDDRIHVGVRRASSSRGSMPSKAGRELSMDARFAKAQAAVA